MQKRNVIVGLLLMFLLAQTANAYPKSYWNGRIWTSDIVLSPDLTSQDVISQDITSNDIISNDIISADIKSNDSEPIVVATSAFLRSVSGGVAIEPGIRKAKPNEEVMFSISSWYDAARELVTPVEVIVYLNGESSDIVVDDKGTFTVKAPASSDTELYISVAAKTDNDVTLYAYPWPFTIHTYESLYTIIPISEDIRVIVPYYPLNSGDIISSDWSFPWKPGDEIDDSANGYLQGVILSVSENSDTVTALGDGSYLAVENCDINFSLGTWYNKNRQKVTLTSADIGVFINGELSDIRVVDGKTFSVPSGSPGNEQSVYTVARYEGKLLYSYPWPLIIYTVSEDALAPIDPSSSEDIVISNDIPYTVNDDDDSNCSLGFGGVIALCLVAFIIIQRNLILR